MSQQREGDVGDLALDERVEQGDAPLRLDSHFVEQPDDLALGLEDPLEPEQLVLDVVELAVLLGGDEQRVVAGSLDRVGEVPRASTSAAARRPG